MKSKKNSKNKTHVLKRAIAAVPGGLILAAAGAICAAAKWLDITYDMEFSTLLYTLISPIKGTGSSVVHDIIKTCLPPVLICLLAYICIMLFLCQDRISVTLTANVMRKERTFDMLKIFRRTVPVLCIAALVSSLIFSYNILGIDEWVSSQNMTTEIYENYYVDPDKKNISPANGGKTKNIIYIYVESLETTYASSDVGGGQPHNNYIPKATELALSEENVSFSNNNMLGGFRPTTGAGWTMGAIFSTTTGLPFSFPADNESIVTHEKFASGVTSLGDILHEKGYIQEFLCGSDAEFAGRKDYFTQHGDYEIFDYFTAIEKGYIDKDYYVWWGFEDRILYEIAKDEALRLSGTGKPFNLTFLTVDQHSVGGYVCPECGNEYDEDLANVLVCGDNLLADFVDWCKAQDFYKDTVIVITGDHPRMDTILVDGAGTRTVYNCFINTGLEPELSSKNRTCTTQDIFPTVLRAAGFSIEGNRLGLGTDLFSKTPTLSEELGFSYYGKEISKKSLYYIANFS